MVCLSKHIRNGKLLPLALNPTFVSLSKLGKFIADYILNPKERHEKASIVFDFTPIRHRTS